jgi:hypothetical protein
MPRLSVPRFPRLAFNVHRLTAFQRPEQRIPAPASPRHGKWDYRWEARPRLRAAVP